MSVILFCLPCLPYLLVTWTKPEQIILFTSDVVILRYDSFLNCILLAIIVVLVCLYYFRIVLQSASSSSFVIKHKLSLAKPAISRKHFLVFLWLKKFYFSIQSFVECSKSWVSILKVRQSKAPTKDTAEL